MGVLVSVPRTRQAGAPPEAARSGAGARREAPAPRRLDNNANNVASRNSEAEDEAPWWAIRRTRSALRWVLRNEFPTHRIGKCGMVSRRAEGVGLVVDLSLPVGKRVAGYRGLASCGSVWACPRCAAVIGRTRAAELQQVIDWWQKDHSGEVMLMTFTVRHHKGHSLFDVWNAVAGGWTALTRNSKTWKALRADGALGGYVRAVEVTHGEHGWHVHVHVLALVRDPADLFAAWDHLQQTWFRAVERLGFSAREGGQDLRLAGHDAVEVLSGYVTKGVSRWSVADEATRWSVKKGRGESRTPFEILADLAFLGDAEALDLFRAWVDGSWGRRQLEWTPRGPEGLRVQAGLVP